MGGTAATTAARSLRDCSVLNSVTMARLTPINSSPTRTPTSRIARRESRSVLPKMLPKP
jgi:hypothetical protein